MGIATTDRDPCTVAELLQDVPGERQKQLRMPNKNAPVLLPAHLDTLVQTSPTPEPEPLIALFLHGPERGASDVQVVWREDLKDSDPSDWGEIVGLCPPSSREAMPVQIGTFRRWFAGKARADETESDMEGARVSEDELQEQRWLPALVWRGDATKSHLAHDARDVRPGDTIVLRASDEGWNDLGHIPDGWQIDVGDRTRFDLLRGVSLRLHPELIEHWPETPSRQAIKSRIKDDDLTREEVEDLLRAYGSELEGQWPAAFLAEMEKLFRRQLQKYPNGEGYVLQGRIRHGGTTAKEEVSLDDHLHDVEKVVEQIAASAVEPTLLSALKTAARFHDYGKADLRYQAWLRGGDALAAFYAPRLIAKSGRTLTRRQQECGLPEDFRHELVSLLFAAKSSELKQDIRDLTLHLIASHHGRCRPFAPVVLDEGAECLTVRGLSICKQERIEGAAHKMSSGTSDRFWSLTRHYGWWGLAYLEALLRLADWKASGEENAEVWE
jgi:CRISPR-associated endonuclease/helicase Cas3